MEILTAGFFMYIDMKVTSQISPLKMDATENDFTIIIYKGLTYVRVP